MSKTFTDKEAERKSQIDQYMKNRLKAVNFAMGSQASRFLLDKDIEHVNPLWHQVPKLRELVFTWMFSSLKHEFELAKLLLSHSSVVTIHCMLEFTSSEIRTLAHAEQTIWEEVDAFLTASEALKKELGEEWPFYRLLRPQDTTLASSKFPNLAHAAVIFVKRFINKSTSFERVVVPNKPTISQLTEKSQKLDTTAKKGAVERSAISEQARKGATRLKIDVDQWMATAEQREKLIGDDPTAGLQEIIERAVASYKSQIPRA